MQGAGGANIRASKAAFHTALPMQLHRALPRLAHFKGALAGNFTLTAVDAMVKINPQGVSLGIVANHIGGAVLDDKIGERKIKQFTEKKRISKDLREGSIDFHGNLRFTINR